MGPGTLTVKSSELILAQLVIKPPPRPPSTAALTEREREEFGERLKDSIPAPDPRDVVKSEKLTVPVAAI
jgi:hypothetical protein